MKKIMLMLLGAVLFGFVVEAKELVKKKEIYHTVWEKQYGGKDADIARAIVALEEGDYAIVGTCKSFNAQRTDICVTRMNSQGELIWRLLLGGKKKDEGKAITRAVDGSILVLGTSKSLSTNYDMDLYVAKISLEGKLIWEKSIGGDRDEFAGGIVGTDDGGVVVVGDTESFGNSYKDIYMAKLDKNGELLAARTLGGSREDSIKGLVRTKDGSIIAVGHRDIHSAGNTDFFIMKLDQNAKHIWVRTYGGEYSDALLGVTATLDGGIVAIGKTRSYGSKLTDLSVMKFDISGKLKWHNIYGFKYYEYGNAVTTTQDGGFLLAGGTSTLGKGNHSIYSLALDKSGKLIWSHVYGGTEKDVAHGVACMSDGSIVMVGESESYSRDSKFLMIKVSK